MEWFEQRKDTLYEEITDTIHFEDFDELIQHFIEEIKTPLPYGFSAEAAAYVVVHTMCFHDQARTRDLKYDYGLPANGLGRLLNRVQRYIESFNVSNIQWGTIDQREAVARRGMPTRFHAPLLTFIIDGTHVPVMYHDPVVAFGLDGDSGSSYKLGRWAVNFQVALDAEMQCIWTDDGQPGGVHDIRAVWRSDLERIVHARDVGMGDLGYMNNRLSFLILTPYKKPTNGELSDRERNYNEQFNSKRVEIEQYFGLLKLKFPIFRCGYRGPLKVLPSLFRLGCVLINRYLLRERNVERERRDAYLLERREQRDFEDVPYEGNVDRLPEFRRRRRSGRVMTMVTPRQEEDEEWEISSHRRSNIEEYQLRFGRLVQQRADQERNDRQFYDERMPEIARQRAAAMAE